MKDTTPGRERENAPQSTFDLLRTVFMDPTYKIDIREDSGQTYVGWQGRDPVTNERIFVQNGMIRPHVGSSLVPRYVLRIVDKKGNFRKTYGILEADVRVTEGFLSGDMKQSLKGKALEPLHDLINRTEFEKA